MPFARIDTDPSRRKLREFNLLWFPLFVALAGWTIGRRTGSWPVAEVVWGVGGGAVLVGLVAPAFARALFIGLSYATFPMGWVVSHALLLVIFFGVLTPAGVLLRLLGYDGLRLRRPRGAASHWRKRPPGPPGGSYLRPY